MASSLSTARLRELLVYNPCTGIFRWRQDGRGRFMRKGAIAGTISRRTGRRHRRNICIDRIIYPSGVLAWLWMTGKRSKKMIDHKNGNPLDDRWINLREATHSQNGANAFDRKSRIAFKGVVYVPPKGTLRHVRPYQAQIRVNYRNIYLGRFDTAKKAHAAYLAAAQKYFGEFSRA